jgi:hypothetical protein
VVISISHLNIIDAIVHFSARYKTALLEKCKDMPAEKETEKDTKEKNNEEEKMLQKSHFFSATIPGIQVGEQYFCYCCKLYKNPCHEKDIQPPKNSSHLSFA